ncbi:MAG: response regulator [Spirochaetes bacterium]|nr:response regulator [Spirochaetota bacterium]
MPKARIMIVEDDAIIAEDLKCCLEELGYEVTSIHSKGEEAVSKVNTENPDLLLMDIYLKGFFDGIETSTVIKKRFKNIPIIYISAFSDQKLLQRASKTEPIMYIVKPFEEIQLKKAIENALKTK